MAVCCLWPAEVSWKRQLKWLKCQFFVVLRASLSVNSDYVVLHSVKIHYRSFCPVHLALVPPS